MMLPTSIVNYGSNVSGERQIRENEDGQHWSRWPVFVLSIKHSRVLGNEELRIGGTYTFSWLTPWKLQADAFFTISIIFLHVLKIAQVTVWEKIRSQRLNSTVTCIFIVVSDLNVWAHKGTGHEIYVVSFFWVTMGDRERKTQRESQLSSYWSKQVIKKNERLLGWDLDSYADDNLCWFCDMLGLGEIIIWKY